MRILETEYSRSRRVTVCQIWVVWQGEHQHFAGVAIRHPDDDDNPTLGENLAWSRAMGKALKRVQRWTDGQVKMMEHNANLKHKPLEVWYQELETYRQRFENASGYIQSVLELRVGVRD